MIFINAYEYVGQYGDINTMIFRYKVLSELYGAELPEDLKINTLTDDTKDRIGAEEHKETADRVLFMFGAGIIDEDTVLTLIVDNKADYYDDVCAAERKAISDDAENEEDRLPYELIQDVLLCAVKSKKYAAFQTVSFDEAAKLAGLHHVRLVNGTAKVVDFAYYKFLVELGEKFGYHNTKNDTIVIDEKAENLLGDENVINGEINSEFYPFALNLKNLLYYSRVWDKMYGKEFIIYAKDNSIPVDENFSGRYEEYVRNTKLHFRLKRFVRKRNICGDRINWFDYAAASNTEVTNNLYADMELEINLQITEDYTNEELVQKALSKYLKDYPLENGTVLELFHDKEKYLYVFKKSSLVPLDDKEFHKLLFDFNKIWGIIQECSRNRKIKKVRDKIVIPNDMWNEITPQEREYAERLIQEQYIRKVEKLKHNKLLQTLSDLNAAAANARSEIESENDFNEQWQKEVLDKRSERESAAVDTANNDTEE